MTTMRFQYRTKIDAGAIATARGAALLVLLLAAGVGAGRPQARSTSGPKAPTIGFCKFLPVNGVWQGHCGIVFGDNENPVLTIAPAKTVTTGKWRKGADPTTVWAGDLRFSNDTEPLEIETYAGGIGVLRIADGWFPISKFSSLAKKLTFEVNTSHEVAPSDLDRDIVKRAELLLSSESVWNRADTRECAPADTKWSIYCAMQRASIEVTGGFHHRRPALQVVRKIVEERTAGRPYTHRLMDYNNDPSTRFKDVRTLFVEALAQMSR